MTMISDDYDTIILKKANNVLFHSNYCFTFRMRSLGLVAFDVRGVRPIALRTLDRALQCKCQLSFSPCPEF